MKEKITVVKIGGAVLEQEESLNDFLNQFLKIEGKKVLVHGGGREATRLSERLGIETRMVEGRRITDADTIEIVTMVYGGSVNKRVVAMLQARGIDTIGLTGADGGIIRSDKRKPVNGIDYGFVGDVKKVKGVRILEFIRIGMTPVIAPLTLGNDGLLLNTNADTIASEVAVALSEFADVELVYCFEKPGVLRNPDDEASVLSVITTENYKSFVEEGIVTGGMIPKIDNAIQAIKRGVREVRITGIGRLSDKSAGTTITEK